MRHAVVVALLASCVYGDTAQVTVPATVIFTVANAGIAVSSAPATVNFQNAVLTNNYRVRISVRPKSATMQGPAGAAIPASSISWTISSASNGVGSPGTLNNLSHGQVFNGLPNAASGSVTLVFTLAALPAGTRAGVHTLNLEWKFESVP